MTRLVAPAARNAIIATVTLLLMGGAITLAAILAFMGVGL